MTAHEWTLYRLVGSSEGLKDGAWKSYMVGVRKGQERRRFYIGCDGESIAKGGEVDRLVSFRPDLARTIFAAVVSDAKESKV